MGHHVSKSKKRSFGNLTSESQQTSTPKQKTSSKLTKESKTATSTKGGASSKKSSQKGKMPLLRWQSGQSKKRYQTQIFEVYNNGIAFITCTCSTKIIRGRRGRDHMVIGFITTYATSAYHH
jgi:hypothetical protein